LSGLAAVRQVRFGVVAPPARVALFARLCVLRLSPIEVVEERIRCFNSHDLDGDYGAAAEDHAQYVNGVLQAQGRQACRTAGARLLDSFRPPESDGA
jgi:hypothetical protein